MPVETSAVALGALARRVAAALAGAGRVRTRDAHAPGVVWIRLELLEERQPLRVDVMASTTGPAERVIYMLPGGGSNFASAYDVPSGRGLAQFLCGRGYLVIGISPREDSVAPATSDFTFMADWGIAKRRADIRSVVSVVQAAAPLPYEVLGHSYGAVAALDYAAHHASEPTRVIALDIYSFDPSASPLSMGRAAHTLAAHQQLMRLGVFVDPSYASTPQLLQRALDAPRESSYAPRLFFGHPGSFTNEGLLAFGFLESQRLPGIHTALSMLPGDWPLRGGYFAGSYTFARDPRDDTYRYTHIEPDSLRAVSARAGSGFIPMAFARDYWAVVADAPAYTLPWERITAEVLWLNSEHGYGSDLHGAERIRAAGNSAVTSAVIAGYGHADLLWGSRAHEDVWPRLVRAD